MNKVLFFRFVVFLVLVSSVFSLSSAHAVEYLPIVQCGRISPDAPPAQGVPCTSCDFFKMVKNTIDLMLYMVTPAIATALFIYAGFMMLLSGANPSLYSGAKNIFTNTVYAVIIILTAWLITNTFIQTFGPANIADNWWNFQCPAGLP